MGSSNSAWRTRGRPCGMRKVLAETVCLVCLVCDGDAFSGTGSTFARAPQVALASQRPSCSLCSFTRLCGREYERSLWLPKGCAGRYLAQFSAACSRDISRPTLLRASKEEAAGAGDGGQTNEESMLQRMANVPILGIFVRFARWIAALVRSILLVRLAVLCQAMAQLKTVLLDPQRRLSSPSPGRSPSATPGILSPLSATAAAEYVAEVARTEAAQAPGVPPSLSPTNSRDLAFEAFWSQMDKLSSHPSVQGELANLQAESARQRSVQEEALAQASGVQISVLDFVEHGGLPPSVEALTAWLEIRDVDTSLWGCGEAKTVQEFFHELWAGESEALGTATQRVISVVKVRILDHSEAGTWQLYETKQTLCRDGRTRPRNRPLAEKLRPGERVEECCRRGVQEELGSLVGQNSKVKIREGSLQQWEETRMSRSFPGLETLYKLYQVDVEVEGLSLKRTSETFDTEEDPLLSTGKVHRWQWVPCGGVDWDPVST